MNVLMVADVSISKVIGGAERVLFEQSTRLAARGHHVHIVTRRLPEHKKEKEEINGVTEWRYPVTARNTFEFLWSTISNSKRLFEFLTEQSSVNVINFHQPFSALGVVCSRKSLPIKKVYTCHSLSHEEFITRNKMPDKIMRRGVYQANKLSRRYIEKKVLHKSDKIVVLSRFTQEKLQKGHGIGKEKIAIIPGGVDLVRFSPHQDKKEIRRRLQIPEDRMVLFTVRNLVPRMGLENLLYAVSKAVHEIRELYLVIGGIGPLAENLLSLAQRLSIHEHVRFAGFIKEEDLPSYYQMADLFVLPTKELEGFGLVTLEALASGVPVLGTPIGGTAEILGKLDQKYLFKDSGAESMTALIIEICRQFQNNPGLWQDVSSQSRLFVEKNYSWEKNVDLLEELFEIS